MTGDRRFLSLRLRRCLYASYIDADEDEIELKKAEGGMASLFWIKAHVVVVEEVHGDCGINHSNDDCALVRLDAFVLVEEIVVEEGELYPTEHESEPYPLPIFIISDRDRNHS